jgi:hypothetical protein
MKIHFVWFGKNQGPHCTATPVAVDKQCPNDEIWLWILKDNLYDFAPSAKPDTGAPLKDSKVQIMLLDSSQGPLGADNWVPDALNVIKTLIHYKAWAAAKDLAVLLIMYKHGGLYFDTTCMLATDTECQKFAAKAGAKARSLSDAVKALTKAGTNAVPALPLVKDDQVDYQPGAYIVKSVTVGYDTSLKTNPIVKMPHIDVWAYFSPAGHNIFLGAVQSYIKRAKILGLDNKDSPNTAGKTELEGDFRNDVIGMLVTHAMYDGLSGALGPNPDAIKKICWRAAGFPDKPTNLPSGGDDTVNADIVPELGIIKQYKGSWRKT